MSQLKKILSATLIQICIHVLNQNYILGICGRQKLKKYLCIDFNYPCVYSVWDVAGVAKPG